MQIEILNKSGVANGTIDLNDSIFAVEPNENAMHLAVVAYLNNQRQGTRKTKVRSEVSGGGKKPWKQKGRGTARSGSNRSPVWVGGGTIHGPKPHNYDMRLPKQISRLARKSALSLRASENNIVVVEDFNFDKPQTKEFNSFMKNIKMSGQKTLIILPDNSNNLFLSARNIPKVEVAPVASFSTYDILSSKKLLIFKGALDSIEKYLAN
ncbi:MAG: 50S ribosomal protein L4 [Candidatus Kapabacteria bacterium]|nr:50S ribosomal protein L4 [Candidatus Kapabacteria bacterium]